MTVAYMGWTIIFVAQWQAWSKALFEPSESRSDKKLGEVRVDMSAGREAWEGGVCTQSWCMTRGRRMQRFLSLPRSMALPENMSSCCIVRHSQNAVAIWAQIILQDGITDSNKFFTRRRAVPLFSICRNYSIRNCLDNVIFSSEIFWFARSKVMKIRELSN